MAKKTQKFRILFYDKRDKEGIAIDRIGNEYYFNAIGGSNKLFKILQKGHDNRGLFLKGRLDKLPHMTIVKFEDKNFVSKKVSLFV